MGYIRASFGHGCTRSRISGHNEVPEEIVLQKEMENSRVNKMKQMKQSNLIRLQYLLIFTLVLNMTLIAVKTKATNFNDSTEDVWSFQGDLAILTNPTAYSWNPTDWTRGDYIDRIDIVSLTAEGHSVIIECQGEIETSTPFEYFTRPPTTFENFTRPTTPIETVIFPLQTSLSTSMYCVYFNDDTDSTDWEAAIIYIVVGGRGGGGTYYYVGDLTTITIPMGLPRDDKRGWVLDSEGNHHSIDGKELTLNFPEYANVATAKNMVITMQIQMEMAIIEEQPQIQMKGWYWDWAPDEYEFWGELSPLEIAPSITYESTPGVPELQLGWALATIILLIIPIFVLLRKRKS